MNTQLQRSQIRVLIQITRISNSFFAATYTLAGAYLAAGPGAVLTGSVACAAATASLVVAFGFVINDVYDVGVDALAKPRRPIPSGRISRRGAVQLAAALALLAQVIACSIGPLLGLFCLGTIVLTHAYSHRLKSTLLAGNIAMALLIASIVVYGSLATGRLAPKVVAIFLMMFFYILAKEILYAIEDVAGDTLAGQRTTAVRLGRRVSVWLFLVFGSAFEVAALAPWPLGMAGRSYLVATLICSIIPVAVVMLVVAVRPNDRIVFVAGRALRTIWLLSLIPVLLLGQT